MSDQHAEALDLLEADPPIRVIAGAASLPPAAGAGEIRARIAGGLIAGDEELFSALAAALSFPSWFGANWDAVLDCLRSLEAPAGAPDAVTLVIEDAAKMIGAAPRTSALLAETWVSAAIWWARRGVPLRLLLLLEDQAGG